MKFAARCCRAVRRADRISAVLTLSSCTFVAVMKPRTTD